MSERSVRLARLTGVHELDIISAMLANAPNPEMAGNNLERWLASTSSPGLFLDQMLGVPELGSRLCSLLGASQPLADTLIQNPELSALVLEPAATAKLPTRESIEREGRAIVAVASGLRHRLDRLRFLKQRWTIPIVMHDLASDWPQEVVWRALSDLAEAVMSLALELVSLGGSPFSIAAFGKLGGREVNYSSDIDLVYVGPDGVSESGEKDATRIAQAFGNALEERMGRGALYRVDLRLRPFGGTGPIVRSMRAIESYYQLYAEPWEAQALLRSRIVVDGLDMSTRWEAMRLETAFPPRLSEIAVEEMLASRERTEAAFRPDDLKRGSGGIRDIEFLTQILQRIHGHAQPDLVEQNTCEAIRALTAAGHLSATAASGLVTGYTFLRRCEHRIQLLGDRQTHELPADPAARQQVARSLGFTNANQLEEELGAVRRTISELYQSTFETSRRTPGNRYSGLDKMGDQKPVVAHWMEGLPSSDQFVAMLDESASARDRVSRICRHAPALVATMRDSVELSEMLLSGEIEEEEEVAFEEPRSADPIRDISLQYVRQRTRAIARWVLNGGDLPQALNRILEGGLLAAFQFASPNSAPNQLDMVALGSFATGDTGLRSDADLLFLVADPGQQPGAERVAQTLLAALSRMRRMGADISLDLRLRPDGGKGLLVRTDAGFMAYELDGMELWERFALGQSRLILGRPAAIAMVRRAAFADPLTPHRLAELLAMKRRIELERVSPIHARRHLKLGPGSLNDIEWLIHLTEMRHQPGPDWPSMWEDRLRRLVAVERFNAVERDLLSSARRFLLELRDRTALQGVEDDLLPENPDRLDRIAEGMGLAKGTELLKRHAEITRSVRNLYEEGMDRCKS